MARALALALMSAAALALALGLGLAAPLAMATATAAVMLRAILVAMMVMKAVAGMRIRIGVASAPFPMFARFPPLRCLLMLMLCRGAEAGSEGEGPGRAQHDHGLCVDLLIAGASVLFPAEDTDTPSSAPATESSLASPPALIAAADVVDRPPPIPIGSHHGSVLGPRPDDPRSSSGADS